VMGAAPRIEDPPATPSKRASRRKRLELRLLRDRRRDVSAYCQDVGVDTPQDNPAGRLHWLLSTLKNFETNTPIETALARALDLLEEEDPARLHEAVAVAARWPGDAEALARGIEGQNHDLVLQWVPQVRAAVVWLGRWGHTINNAQNEYNDTTLYSLAVTADLLHRLAPEPVIEEDSLAGLVTLVQEVMDAVVGDDELSPEAREFLLSRLIDVQNALMYFRIRGYPGVEDAMDRLVGGLVRTPAAQSEQSKAGIKRIWAAIQGALTGAKQIADTSTAAAAAIEAGKNLLG
jgi:hypothetical protein